VTVAADEKSVKTYEGLGPAELAPSSVKGFDFGAAGLMPEDYFMLTRVDGRTSYRQLVLISGFPEEKAVPILRKLRERGALLHPGETTPPPPPAPKPLAPPPPPLPAVDPGDVRLAEAVDLTLEQKTAILAKHMSLRAATYFQVLEVAADVDRKALKAAYRKISKDFHPDRFFGKKLGAFKAMLAEIFDVASQAMETLSDDERREGYVLSLSVPAPVVDPPSGRGPPARAQTGGGPPKISKAMAAEIFEAACSDQVAGDLKAALEKFAAAVAADPQIRWVRRAADCALKAQELSLALEYAKKAKDMDALNAQSHRILGKVQSALGRNDEARGAFAEALRLDPGNPHILAELRELDKKLR
jgi:hypothetical protein